MTLALAAQQPLAPRNDFLGLRELIAPVRIEVGFTVRRDGRAVCQVAVNGEEQREDGIDSPTCTLLMGSEGSEMLRRIPPGTALTANVTMALDDEELPPRSLVDRGDLVYDSSARVRVNRAGMVSNCEALGEHLRGPLERMQGTAGIGMPPLCDVPGLNQQRMFRAAPGGPAARFGTLRMELFLRLATSNITV